MAAVAATLTLVGVSVLGPEAGTGITALAATGSTTPTIGVVRAPVISGSARDGHTLTVSNGSWSVSGLAFAYIWYRSGVRLPITTNRFTLTGWDVGKTITVRVRATRAGYTSKLAETHFVGPVSKPDASFRSIGGTLSFPLGSKGFPRGVYYAHAVGPAGSQCSAFIHTAAKTGDTGWPNYSTGQTFLDTTAAKYVSVSISSCGPWYAMATAGPAREVVTDGSYRTHSQIVPGTYRSQAPSTPGCQWFRLSGANSDQIIATGLPHTSSTVTVKVLPTDYAFEAESCGTWTKVG